MNKIINGRKIAEDWKKELKGEVGNLREKGLVPGLAVIIVGDNPASQVYVRKKIEVCKEVGINSQSFSLPKRATQLELTKLIRKLNKDRKVHGILVQLPLPKHIDEAEILEMIDPQKDVDCFHPENVGRLMIGAPRYLPCTPAGVIELLKRSKIEIERKNCVVVGRSNIVGKPLALMLLQAGGTISICHSKTRDLAAECCRADILVSAVGKIGLITKDMVKKGAVVIDVGINRGKDGKLTGDVDFKEVAKIAKFITPVPGGVGPMTIVMLMKNTIKAAKNI